MFTVTQKSHIIIFEIRYCYANFKIEDELVNISPRKRENNVICSDVRLFINIVLLFTFEGAAARDVIFVSVAIF